MNKLKNKDTKINNNGIPKFLKVKSIKEVNGLRRRSHEAKSFKNRYFFIDK